MASWSPLSFGSAPMRLRASRNTKFRNSVCCVVADLEQHIGEPLSILRLGKRHHLKVRRLYDVVNVLSAIGCARRLNSEEIVWLGRDEINEKLQHEKKSLGLTNTNSSLSEMFPPENSVGLTSLTIAFLMLFPALATREIDLRQASSFFARTTKKYKTVLIKLYQIAVILGALGLIEKTQNMSEVRILQPIERLLCDDQSPISIGNLLNRPNHNADQYTARRHEYISFLRPGTLVTRDRQTRSLSH
jgi:hypothetical protein